MRSGRLERGELRAEVMYGGFSEGNLPEDFSYKGGLFEEGGRGAGEDRRCDRRCAAAYCLLLWLMRLRSVDVSMSVIRRWR